MNQIDTNNEIYLTKLAHSKLPPHSRIISQSADGYLLVTWYDYEHQYQRKAWFDSNTGAYLTED